MQIVFVCKYYFTKRTKVMIGTSDGTPLLFFRFETDKIESICPLILKNEENEIFQTTKHKKKKEKRQHLREVGRFALESKDSFVWVGVCVFVRV